MAQEAICYLLAEKAREGRVVARLKWGDPFVFDRGGEEALFLHEQGVPFEVVPGIPAALGVPSYAGVPLTYPGAGDTLTLVRGHEDERQTAPAWTGAAWRSSKARSCATPARGSSPRSSTRCSRTAAPRREPAAVIFDGTLPSQHTDRRHARASSPSSQALSRPDRPAILVVGRAAALRQHLRWFDARPLFGRRIVVTTPREDARGLVDRLAALGADADRGADDSLRGARRLGAARRRGGRASSTFAWIVFTSANAVDHFMARLYRRQPGRPRVLKGVRLCAVGPATRDRLRRYRLRSGSCVPDDIPRRASSARSPQSRAAAGNARCWCRARTWAGSCLREELRGAGAEVTDVTAYRTIPRRTRARRRARRLPPAARPRHRCRHLHERVSRPQLRARVIGEEQAADLLQQTTVACIGPVTAEAAAQLGILTTIMPGEYTVPRARRRDRCSTTRAIGRRKQRTG